MRGPLESVGAYFLEGSATTKLRWPYACPWPVVSVLFRSVHSAVGFYHRVSTGTQSLGLHDDSSSRRWVTLASGRPCFSSRATPSNRKCLSPVHILCPVPLAETLPRPCARISYEAERERECSSPRQRSLIPASGTWNRTALCFSS